MLCPASFTPHAPTGAAVSCPPGPSLLQIPALGIWGSRRGSPAAVRPKHQKRAQALRPYLTSANPMRSSWDTWHRPPAPPFPPPNPRTWNLGEPEGVPRRRPPYTPNQKRAQQRCAPTKTIHPPLPTPPPVRAHGVRPSPRPSLPQIPALGIWGSRRGSPAPSYLSAPKSYYFSRAN